MADEPEPVDDALEREPPDVPEELEDPEVLEEPEPLEEPEEPEPPEESEDEPEDDPVEAGTEAVDPERESVR